MNCSIDTTPITDEIAFQSHTVAESIDNSTVVFIAIAILAAVVIWAEWQRDQWMLYLLATLTCATMAIFLWSELSYLRFVVIGAGVYCALQTALSAQARKQEWETEEQN